jgi:DNA polymerase III delta subunit
MFGKVSSQKSSQRQACVLVYGENQSEIELVKLLETQTAPSLFSSKKLIIARNCLPTKSSQTILIAGITKLMENLPQDYFLVFWQDSLDRRLTFIKNLVKQVKLVEFELPHGLQLNSWIKKQATALGLNIDAGGVEKLAVLSGRDLFEEKKAGGRIVERKEFFDLWQIYTDLQKLASYSDHTTAKDVGELVAAKLPENVFALSDAVVAQNKKQALEILEILMREENSDEKSMSIKLLGLITEQIRSLLVVSLLKSKTWTKTRLRVSWAGVRAGYSSLSKTAPSHGLINSKNSMARLLEADALIKSSDTNPKLLIDLLIGSIKNRG